MNRRCIAMLCALAVMIPTHAVASETPAPSAASAILVDGDTGRVLFEKNPHEKRLIASITKLMTALVVVESFPDLSQTVTIQREWTGAEGSSMYLSAGESLTVETLLYGLLLASGNDAAIALAGICAGDVEHFVEWMNLRAESLGMENTHFSNPNGLNDEEHYSTAYDMSLLARECLKYSQLMEIMGTRSITVEGRSFANHNKLLWRYEGCIGMKTGYTQKAGRTLVSAAERDGQTLICVTLTDPNDWEDHADLLDYGFETYPKHVLAKAGKKFRTLPVSGSLVRTVAVETSHDVSYPLTEEEQVRAVIDLPETIEAPVEAGTVAGSLSFWVGEEEIGRTYLLYSTSIRDDGAPSGSIFERALDYLRSDKPELLSVFYPIHAASAAYIWRFPMEERLQKILSAAGICSRRAAEPLLEAGRVTVNGQVAKLGDKADIEKDDIRVDGVALRPVGEKTYIMLHKPVGYVTTLSDERGRATVAELVENCGTRVWPVGRLDQDSEGLLLLTDDGDMTYRLTHPSHEIDKEYHVTVAGNMAEALPVLQGYMELDGIPLAPAVVREIGREGKNPILSVIIHEGRNRQVRRMCAAAGLEVLRLVRVREGTLVLGSLKRGTWRYLTKEEIAYLKEI